MHPVPSRYDSRRGLPESRSRASFMSGNVDVEVGFFFFSVCLKRETIPGLVAYVRDPIPPTQDGLLFRNDLLFALSLLAIGFIRLRGRVYLSESIEDGFCLLDVVIIPQL